MGCGSSSTTAVHPLTPEEVKRDEDDTGSKLDSRGDSAVSKGTADSGVVTDSTETSDLPGAVPRKLLPVSSVIESETDGVKQDGLLQKESAVQERQNSSEILEELLLQGIIPAGQSRERSSGAGEAFSIMLSDSDGAMRRPPARLESLRAKKAQHLPSREEIDEKIRLADERRRLKEDELKTRLRYKSARVRRPAAAIMDMDAELTPVETLRSPPIPDTPNPPPQSQIPREEAEGGELVREASVDGRESEEETSRAERRDGRVERGGKGESTGVKRQGEIGDGEEELEFTQVEELKERELLTASGELECDTSFQQVVEMF